jgi:hypothetical protein
VHHEPQSQFSNSFSARAVAIEPRDQSLEKANQGRSAIAESHSDSSRELYKPTGLRIGTTGDWLDWPSHFTSLSGWPGWLGSTVRLGERPRPWPHVPGLRVSAVQFHLHRPPTSTQPLPRAIRALHRRSASGSNRDRACDPPATAASAGLAPAHPVRPRSLLSNFDFNSIHFTPQHPSSPDRLRHSFGNIAWHSLASFGGDSDCNCCAERCQRPHLRPLGNPSPK